MDDNKICNKDFIEAVCKLCKICSDPSPEFCMALYDANRPKFLHHVIYKVCLLREADPKKLIHIDVFEGFCALFCRSVSCPKYDKTKCNHILSKRMACYEKFLRQQDIHIGVKEISNIYSVWSGIDLSLIGNDLKLLEGLQYLPKKKKKHVVKKIKRIMQKAYHGQSRNFTDKNKTKEHKPVSTLLFHNQGDDVWGKKLEEYLNEDNNRQQSKASGATE